MKLFQPNKIVGIHIENIKFPASDQNNLFTVTQQAFCSEIENST